MNHRGVLAGLCLLLPCAVASGQGTSRSGYSSDGGMGPVVVPAGVSRGWAGYPYPYYETIGPDGPLIYIPPPSPFAIARVLPWFSPLMRPPAVPPRVDPGIPVAGPVPFPAMAGLKPVAPASKARRTDPSRSTKLVTYGDRLFRAGNIRKAAERFEQAEKANPNAAAPRIRLAQVALVRGNFAEAANQIRDALTAEPGWLITAPDIQAIYGEPGDFSKQIAKLESHVHAHPADRDAWLVLGAELYLSGRTRKAADIFLRLTDRKPDPTLAAFLEVTAPRDPERP